MGQADKPAGTRALRTVTRGMGKGGRDVGVVSPYSGITPKLLCTGLEDVKVSLRRHHINRRQLHKWAG